MVDLMLHLKRHLIKATEDVQDGDKKMHSTSYFMVHLSINLPVELRVPLMVHLKAHLHLRFKLMVKLRLQLSCT